MSAFDPKRTSGVPGPLQADGLWRYDGSSLALGEAMRRREAITLLGGAAASWPLGARAQSDRMRRIGILAGLSESDTEGQTWVRELTGRLQELGWTNGRNFVI